MKFLIICSLLSFYAYGQSLKKSAKPTALRLSSNAEQASILREGILAGEVKKGTPLNIEASPGWNEIVISGPNIIERKVKIFVSNAGVSDVYIETSPKLTQVLPIPQSLPEVDNFRSLANTPSHCSAVLKSTPSSQISKIGCSNKSFLEDIQKIGLRLTNELDATQAVMKQSVLEFKRLIQNPWQSGWIIKSEEIHTSIATNSLGLEAVMLSNILNNNCTRVFEMAKEGIAQGMFSPSMYLMTGVCLNLADQSEAIITLYKPVLDVIKLPAESNSSISALFWHTATQQLLFSSAEATKTLERCVNLNPWYRPCSTLLRDLYFAQGFLKKAQMIQFKLAKETEKRILPVVDSIFAHLSKKDYEKAEKVITSLPRMKETFEVGWLKVLMKHDQNLEIAPEDASNAYNGYITNEKTAIKILPIIEKTLKSEWIENAYKSFTRDLPKNGFYWWKLAKFYMDENRCRDVVILLTGVEVEKKDQQTAITELLGRCLITIKDYSEGIKVLKKMTSLAPSDWKSHYQLAEAFSKASRNAEAKSSYMEALSLKPPEKFLHQIEKKVKETPVN